MATVPALQQRPRAQTHRLALATATRAAKALRPTPLFKRLFALIFGPISLEKIRKTQAVLKLKRVLGHRASPPSFVYSECSLDGQIRLRVVNNQEIPTLSTRGAAT